jgi:glucokinase
MGGTYLRVGVVVERKVVWEQRVAARFSSRLKAEAPEEALATVVEALLQGVREALGRFPEVDGVGLAVPGFLDPRTGRLASSPNVPGVRDADLVTPLRDALGVPVVAENDALAAAWGEWAMHPERPESLVYLGLGTGVGGGLVLDGRPYRGEHGVALEVGHLILEPGGRACGCGNRGCLERYASASGVSLSYQEATGRTLEAREVAERARGGDPDALRALEAAGEALGRAAAHLLKVLDVSHVVIGGGLTGAWDLMSAGFQARLDADLIPYLRGRARVSISVSGDQAGMLGAALLAGSI